MSHLDELVLAGMLADLKSISLICQTETFFGVMDGLTHKGDGGKDGVWRS